MHTLKTVVVEVDGSYRSDLNKWLVSDSGCKIVFDTDDEHSARAWLSNNKVWDLCILDVFITQGTGISLPACDASESCARKTGFYQQQLPKPAQYKELFRIGRRQGF